MPLDCSKTFAGEVFIICKRFFSNPLSIITYIRIIFMKIYWCLSSTLYPPDSPHTTISIDGSKTEPFDKCSVKILTYNTELILARSTYDRAEKFVKYINNNDYDVISVQETFDYEIKDLITKKCHENGYSHIISRAGQPACRGIFYESGLMIISKLPILNAETIHYNQASGSDVMANKGFLVADIDFNGQIITVVNTHLQSGNDMVSLEKRINQFEQLKNAIKQKKNGKMIVT